MIITIGQFIGDNGTGTGTGAGTVSDWILDSGIWNDDKFWRDEKTWID